jgi:hypothetical protein
MSLILLFTGVGSRFINALDQPLPVECETSLENEFSTTGETQDFSIELQALGRITVIADHALDTKIIKVALFDPSGARVAADYYGKIDNFQVAASGTYIIQAQEFQAIGLYTLSISCVLRNDDPTPTHGTPGYPNLAPTALPNAAQIPLSSGSSVIGVIGIEGDLSYIYTFDNNVPGNVLSLQVDRTLGNLNLGIVVLSPTSNVLFYGGIIASDTLSATLPLSDEGKYIIGVFMADLMSPTVPEVTTFQVSATFDS